MDEITKRQAIDCAILFALFMALFGIGRLVAWLIY